MNYHYKKKRYKLKPVAVIIALVIIAIITLFAIFLIKRVAKPSLTPSSSDIQQSSSISSTTDKASSSISSITDKASSTKSPQSSEKSSTVSKPSPATTKPSSISDTDATSASSKSAWNLVLLNRENSISKDMNIKKTQFDTQWIDSRVAPAYQKMIDGAKAAGITLFLRSGYRSISTQRINYQADINRNMKNGYTKEQATLLTEKYYARPGQSEHHTGLALDIITPEYHRDIHTLSEKFAETDAYKWLVENCANYGFILRYPADKTDITKINYEPWHYRYVGIEPAKYITENGLTFEEYLNP